MFGKRQIILLLAVTATLFAAWVVNPRTTRAEETRTWRIGYSPWIAADLAVYAEEVGLFAKYGLDVELIRLDEGSDVARALMSGDLDAAFCALGTIVANSDGAALDVVLVTDVSNGTDGIVVRAGLTGLADSTGLRIGCKQRAINRLILAEALDHAGMSQSDIVVEDVSNTAAKRMLSEGLLDGAVLWEPDLSEVAEAIGGRVVYRTSELNSVVVDVLIARSDRASGREQDIAALRSAWFELLEHIDERPEEVFAVVGEVLQQDPGALRDAWSGVRAGDESLNARLLGDGFPSILLRTARYLQKDVPVSIRVSPVLTPWRDNG